MSEAATPNVLEATRILEQAAKSRNGGQNGDGDGYVSTKPPDGARLKELEQKLAAEGHDGLAREMRRLRAEADSKKAERILGGIDATPAEMLKLAKRLAEYKKLGLARRVLRRARLQSNLTPSAGAYVEVYQKSALYTYKDPDLPLEWRLRRALEILSALEDLSKTQSQETLGLAGAIQKRMWEVDGQRKHLWRALGFYLRGYEQGAPPEARPQLLTYLREHPDCVFSPGDQGYAGINTALVLDMLAQQEEEDADSVGLVSEAARDKREFARLIRGELVRSVSTLCHRQGGEWLLGEWWYYATVGAAHFGLGQYEQAVEWLTKRPRDSGLEVAYGETTPAGLEVPEWEFESTARQLGGLARLARPARDETMTDEQFGRLRAEETARAREALRKILREDDKAVESAFRGKFGLGLSGGGFRASLYHIGVLAKLAELDVLRHVEVLSCVSGGSIIGAHYYLEVRHLLQTKRDAHSDEEYRDTRPAAERDWIAYRDYIDIVKRIERDFLAGVQRNIRTRVLAEWVTNLKMIFSASYSRTLRVGELYERELFARVPDGVKFEGPRWLPDWAAQLFGWKRDRRWINDLYIHPMLEDGTRQTDFKPRAHNWRRAAKAPDLILNAATLNTGHNWQFTASWMGEPPTPINREIDTNYRLRRMYYESAPKAYRRFRLGHAVAASSCVPGLFEPLILDGLYPYDAEGKLNEKQQISVRLVDGGAVDNQGINSLLDQDCTVMLISDGSGQMDAQNVPDGGLLGPPLRTNSILQARIREAQYTDVASRRRSSLLRALMFIHLRQELTGESLAWRDCPSKYRESDFERESAVLNDSTSFGVAPGVQRKLSAIRTDLDSFSDAEAYALMASAYRMTGVQFTGQKRTVEGFEEPDETARWNFLRVEDAMRAESADGSPDRRRHLERLLDAGSNIAFKIWVLSRPLKYTAYAAALAALALVVYLFYQKWDEPFSPLAYAAGAYQWLRSYVPFLPAPPALTFGFIGGIVVSAILVTFVTIIVNYYLGMRRGKLAMKAFNWRRTLTDIVVGVVMATAGFLAARVHLYVFDRWFLGYGRLKKFPGAGDGRPEAEGGAVGK